MTRRDLGKLAVAMQVRAARADAPKKYGSALDGFENKVDLAAFDPVVYGRKMHDAAPLQMTFRASNRRQAEQWQKRLRGKITELLGGFPAQRWPLQPQTLEVREFPGYRREKLVFQTRPGMWALAYLLTPAPGKTPHATMVCVPGHGRGVDDIVGIDDKGQDRTTKVDY
jgi:hypothetical protein